MTISYPGIQPSYVRTLRSLMSLGWICFSKSLRLFLSIDAIANAQHKNDFPWSWIILEFNVASLCWFTYLKNFKMLNRICNLHSSFNISRKSRPPILFIVKLYFNIGYQYEVEPIQLNFNQKMFRYRGDLCTLSVLIQIQ